MDRIPCRVSEDLRRHQAAQDAIEVPEFDAFDARQIEDVVGKILAKPVQALLLMEVLGLDKCKHSEIVEAIRELHQAMRDAFVEGL